MKLTKRNPKDAFVLRIEQVPWYFLHPGIHEMGIYRISGSSADIQKLKKAFEASEFFMHHDH